MEAGAGGEIAPISRAGLAVSAARALAAPTGRGTVAEGPTSAIASAGVDTGAGRVKSTTSGETVPAAGTAAVQKDGIAAHQAATKSPGESHWSEAPSADTLLLQALGACVQGSEAAKRAARDVEGLREYLRSAMEHGGP